MFRTLTFVMGNLQNDRGGIANPAPHQELDNRVLRVVTLEDRQTLHNAFPDRGYKP